jgi:hypothetical protein
MSRKIPLTAEEQAFVDRIEAIRCEMESTIGKMYKIDIHRYGTLGKLCELETNTDEKALEVYEICPASPSLNMHMGVTLRSEDFVALVGLYANRRDFDKRVDELANADRFVEIKRNSNGDLIGKCKQCKKFGGDYRRSVLGHSQPAPQLYNYVRGKTFNGSCCQGCGAILDSRFDNIELSRETFDVWYKGGGSLRILAPVAKYRFIE